MAPQDCKIVRGASQNYYCGLVASIDSDGGNFTAIDGTLTFVAMIAFGDEGDGLVNLEVVAALASLTIGNSKSFDTGACDSDVDLVTEPTKLNPYDYDAMNPLLTVVS